jgi:hypothetical protein
LVLYSVCSSPNAFEADLDATSGFRVIKLVFG